MGGRRTGRLFGWLFLGGHFLGVLVFALAPMLRVLLGAFQNAVTGRWVGLRNFAAVWSNSAFRLAAGNTARFVAVCVPLLLILSLGAAVGLRALPVLGDALRGAFLLPMAVPAASVVLVWKALFHRQGLLNAAGAALGWATVDFMGSDASFWVLVGCYVWKNLGYTVVLWLAGLSAIPASVYEAAQVDGANSWQTFWCVTLPSLRATAYILSVLSLLNTFKVFREAWLVAGDYPHQGMYLLQHLYNNWFRDLDYDKIAAASVMTAAAIFGLTGLLARAWDREAEQ